MPIALPTELRVHCGSVAQEHDLEFAQVKEILRHLLKPNSYGWHKDSDSDQYQFWHSRERPCRDRLVPIAEGLHALDKVINK